MIISKNKKGRIKMSTIEKIWDSFSKFDKRKCADNEYFCLENGIYSAMMKHGCVKYCCGCGEQ